MNTETNNKNENLEKKINHLISSLESLFTELPNLEVNTIIVDTITPTYFIPEKIYQDISEISEQYLEKKGINQSLWPSYLELRNNLELEYLIINKNDSQLPLNSTEIQQLLSNSRFLQNLRKIGDIKTILDHRNQQLNNQEKGVENINKNMIYAQTKIGLDGVIINRYSEEILTHPNQDLILEIHRNSISCGQQQWQEFLQNVIELLQKIR